MTEMTNDIENEEQEEPQIIIKHAAKVESQVSIEDVFKGSPNDYLTVLVIARRAREILDGYEDYVDVLEAEKPTAIALREFLGRRFVFEYDALKSPPKGK